ncbi:hypothetical protein [Methanolacinia petrolearia]|nr:hypothetical protein [Methanolacinia petrolearia]
MKMKKAMRALSLLMVLALVGAMFVPAVSAGNTSQSSPKDQDVQYNVEKYTVRLVDSEITLDEIDTQTQKILDDFQGEFKNVSSRYIGAAEPDVSKDEKIVGYVFRILPSGESFSYTETVSADDSISTKEISSKIDAWIDGPLKIKTTESLNKASRSKSRSEPDPIHTAYTSVKNYPDIGKAQLITTWYWDNQETNSNQDYFFTKTTLATDPGIDISGYDIYQNYHFNIEINSDYSLGSYQHLPNVAVSQNNPQTTTGFTTLGLSLGTSSCSLGWSTTIPDSSVILHHSSGNIYNWDEEFTHYTNCARSHFEFTPGQESVCSQSSARGGSTYIISRVKADVSNGWAKINDGILCFAPSGTNAWGHYCKVRWNGDYNHV